MRSVCFPFRSSHDAASVRSRVVLPARRLVVSGPVVSGSFRVAHTEGTRAAVRIPLRARPSWALRYNLPVRYDALT